MEKLQIFPKSKYIDSNPLVPSGHYQVSGTQKFEEDSISNVLTNALCLNFMSHWESTIPQTSAEGSCEKHTLKLSTTT